MRKGLYKLLNHRCLRTSGQSIMLLHLKALEINIVPSGPQKVLRDLYNSCEILVSLLLF